MANCKGQRSSGAGSTSINRPKCSIATARSAIGHALDELDLLVELIPPSGDRAAQRARYELLKAMSHAKLALEAIADCVGR